MVSLLRTRRVGDPISPETRVETLLFLRLRVLESRNVSTSHPSLLTSSPSPFRRVCAIFLFIKSDYLESPKAVSLTVHFSFTILKYIL